MVGAERGAVQPRRQVLAGALGVLLAGCAGDGPPDDVPQGTPPATDAAHLGLTHHRRSGNRLVDGSGAVPDVEPVDVPIEGRPSWIVGIPDGTATVWAVVTDEGAVTGLRLAGRTAERFPLSPDPLPAGTPPLLRGGDPPSLPRAGSGDSSPLSHPMPVDGGLLWVAEDGSLVRAADGGTERLALDALPDARVVTADARASVLADATDRYDHAVLGDGVEAGSVPVVDLEGALSLERRIAPPGDAVVEGIAPLLADVTGDGDRDVLVSVSGDGGGARLVAFRPDGTRLAASPTLVGGWRHQLAVAPFPTDATPEVAAVRMPHVAHELQFLRRSGGDLRVVATADGYQSHTIGSRNLDGALAGDFDGDGRLEVVLPTTARADLAGVRRTADGAEERWSVAVGGTLTTNLAAVTADGRATLAAGHADGVRFWPG